MVARNIIVGHFRDYGAAHRAFYELLQTGIAPNNISIIAGERSYHRDTRRDFGILEGSDYDLAAVHQGKTLLAVYVDAADRARVAAIIEHHAPIEIEENVHRGATAR